MLKLRVTGVTSLKILAPLNKTARIHPFSHVRSAVLNITVWLVAYVRLTDSISFAWRRAKTNWCYMKAKASNKFLEMQKILNLFNPWWRHVPANVTTKLAGSHQVSLRLWSLFPRTKSPLFITPNNEDHKGFRIEDHALATVVKVYSSNELHLWLKITKIITRTIKSHTLLALVKIVLHNAMWFNYF